MNKYDLNEMAIKQKTLDNYIKDRITISDEQYWSDRLIALNVELNELSNEIRFFKYWSQKPASDKSVILDEFVDCVHFSLSLANTVNANDLTFVMSDMKRPLPLIYFDISKKIIELNEKLDAGLLKSLINNILEIAWFMGYDMNDIQKAYDIKNKINYERQNQGY